MPKRKTRPISPRRARRAARAAHAPHPQKASYKIEKSNLPNTRPAPWGTSSIPELGSGPEATITFAKVDNIRHMPAETMVVAAMFTYTGLTVEGHARVTSGPNTPETLAEGLETVSNLVLLMQMLKERYPDAHLEQAQLRLRTAEVIQVVAKLSRLFPLEPEAQEVLASPEAPEVLAAAYVLEAIAMLDLHGMHASADRAAAAAFFATMSPDVPPQFKPYGTKFLFRTPAAGETGGYLQHGFRFTGQPRNLFGPA